MLYLDSNATSQLLPEVLEAMLPWLRDNSCNPSGSYRSAKAARAAIELARQQVAALVCAEPEEIIFTSGGTESVNSALHSLHRLAGEGQLLCSAIEHSSVLRYAESLKRERVLLPVTAGGVVEMSHFPQALENAAFLSVMTANNEIGVIQPIAEIAAWARSKRLPFHTDAIQAAGKIPLNVRDLGVDYLSLSAHKFHGPKGAGALFVRKGMDFSPLLLGGGQEQQRRSGTENVAAIVGMGKAAELAQTRLAQGSMLAICELRNSFEAIILEKLSGVKINGDPTQRLPNTSHISFESCDAAGLLILLDDSNLACSAGSACMTGKQKPSHVQLAMGIPESLAKSSLRFSFSSLNTPDEAKNAAEIVIKSVEKLRRVQSTGVGPVLIYS